MGDLWTSYGPTLIVGGEFKGMKTKQLKKSRQTPCLQEHETKQPIRVKVRGT